MNPFLAELYNTAENIGAGGNDDVEKLAQAQIVNDIIESEGLSIDDVDNETILKVAGQLFGDDNELAKLAAEGEGAPPPFPPKEKKEGDTPEKKEEEKEKEAAEKLAEADFLGRAMAHAMVDELSDLEKEGAAGEAAMKGVKWLAGKAGGAAGRASGAAGRRAEALRGAGKKAKEALTGARGSRVLSSKERLKALGQAAKGAAPELAAGAGIGAAGTAGAMLAGKKKKASLALDALAEQRALELLKEAGVEVDVEPTNEEKLAAAVDERAFEMLKEAGYIEE